MLDSRKVDDPPSLAPPMSLSPRAARTFYNAADALVPPGDGPGAGDVDLVPALETRLTRWGPLRRLGFVSLLAALEWQPLALRRRGFSRLPRAERARLLGRWERSRLAPRRAAARALRDLVVDLFRESQSREGA